MRRARLRVAWLFAALVGVALAAPAGCQLFLENGDQQCESDKDCSAFDNAVCDRSTHLCVGPGSGCTGKDGCYACDPKSNGDFLNACTDAQCQPFDRSRLTHLTSDGGLPPLP